MTNKILKELGYSVRIVCMPYHKDRYIPCFNDSQIFHSECSADDAWEACRLHNDCGQDDNRFMDTMFNSERLI